MNTTPFLNKFGEEGNLVIIGVKTTLIFPKAYASGVK
jgi:hypothetical protein